MLSVMDAECDERKKKIEEETSVFNTCRCCQDIVLLPVNALDDSWLSVMLRCVVRVTAGTSTRQEVTVLVIYVIQWALASPCTCIHVPSIR